MFKRKRGGFTLMELLVVICIIAIVAGLALPAILKARKQASINKAQAEMTGFASTESTIYTDLKSTGYVPLCNYNIIKANISLSGSNFINSAAPPSLLKILSGAAQPSGYATASFTTTDFADAPTFQASWDGPYATFQPNTTLYLSGSLTVGSYPGYGSTTWVNADFPDGTPLDPWGHPYGIAWNITEQVMVIYSAGSDGKFQTNPGDTTVATGNDDLLYKFR